MIPTSILQVWLLGLLSLGVIGGAVYCGREWYRRSWSYDPVLQQPFFDPHFGANEATILFATAVLLLVMAVAGSLIVRDIMWLLRSAETSKGASDDPRRERRKPSSQQRLRRADGSELQVEFYGPEDGQLIVLSHGWGLNSDEWNYLKRELTDGFRLIVWDEPGLGHSTRPANRDFSLENLAHDLDAVLALAGNRPAILLGHSIGGMTMLTFCRLFPEALGTRVAGLVLTHTTHTNPVRTTKGAALYTALEGPLLVPLMYLTIGLSPLVRLMNWLSYLNGSAHLNTKRSSFGGTETWEQLDFATRFQPKASPAVMARGMLGMMRYDATATLGSIDIPALIVAGDQDPVTKPEASERIRAGIPKARLVTLSPAKHLGLIEHHGRYAEAVRGFAHFALAQPLKPSGKNIQW
jgi:pimeloyl-ACP methyl ester carboxylesterase